MRDKNFIQRFFRFRKIRRQPQRLAVMRDSVGQLVLLLQRLREPEMGCGLAGREAQFRQKLRGGGGGLMIVQQGQSEIETDRDVVRLQLGGYGKMDDGFRQIAFLSKGDGKVLLWRGKIRFEFDGYGKLRDGFVEISIVEQNGSQIVTKVGIGGFERDSLG